MTVESSNGSKPPQIDESMRIGILSQWYAPEPTLMPSVLARELARRSHVVHVLTGFPNYPQGKIYPGYRVAIRRDEKDGAVAIRRVALYPNHSRSVVGRVINYGSFALSASIWAGRWFRDVDAIWVANSPPTVGLPTWLLHLRRRPRIVLHILDLWPESLNASDFASPIRKLPGVSGAIDKWLSMTYRVADSIACSTRKQIDVLESRGVERSKLSYVPIWIDEAVFRPAERDEKLAAELGVAGKRVLLYAGAIGETQGLSPLVEVCDRLRNLPDFHCVVAGSGVAEGKIRAEAESRRLENLTFLGPWPGNDMTRLMSVGDVHLVSLRSDPISEFAMPSKLPATLASGKPIIASARGEVAAVVTGAGAGWTCTPGDADGLEAALRSSLSLSERDLKAMGARARAAYDAEFAINIGVSRIEKLLAGFGAES